jgi:hypothetical protein
MPEVFGTWCAGACTVVVPVTPGGMTSALAPLLPLAPLLRLAAYQATPPMITATTATMAPMVIRLRRRSARFYWARRAATRSRRAACLPFFVFGTELPSSSVSPDRQVMAGRRANDGADGPEPGKSATGRLADPGHQTLLTYTLRGYMYGGLLQQGIRRETWQARAAARARTIRAGAEGPGAGTVSSLPWGGIPGSVADDVAGGVR